MTKCSLVLLFGWITFQPRLPFPSNTYFLTHSYHSVNTFSWVNSLLTRNLKVNAFHFTSFFNSIKETKGNKNNKNIHMNLSRGKPPIGASRTPYRCQQCLGNQALITWEPGLAQHQLGDLSSFQFPSAILSGSGMQRQSFTSRELRLLNKTTVSQT